MPINSILSSLDLVFFAFQESKVLFGKQKLLYHMQGNVIIIIHANLALIGSRHEEIIQVSFKLRIPLIFWLMLRNNFLFTFKDMQFHVEFVYGYSAILSKVISASVIVC